MHRFHTIVYAFGLCSLPGLPLFRSSCLFLTRFLCFPLFIYHCYFVGVGLIAVLSIARVLSFECCVFLTGFISCLFSWLLLLTLGFASAKSHPHVQLIRAELSSNGSSEPPSESPSKLSSHQIPRCLRVPLQLKGCTRTSSMFSPTTPSGASVLVLVLSTQHSTSTSGSNRRVPPPRGSSSPVHLGHPLLPALAVWGFSCTRRLLMPRCAACGSTLLWVRSPFFDFYVILLESAYALVLPVRERTDVLSRPRLPVASRIAFGISSFLSGCSAESFCTRAAGRVSRPRLRTSSSSLLYSSIRSFPF